MSTTSKPPKWFLAHRNNVWTYGPLPPLVNVANRNDDEPGYILTLSRKDGPETKEVRSPHHPLSPSGQADWADILPLVPDHSAKPSFIGISHPPLVYRPHEWVWDGSNDMKTTLLKALQLSGVQVTLQDFDRPEAIKAVDQLMQTKAEPYHPRDRTSFASYPTEHHWSCWARYFKRSLVIVAPEIDKKNPKWDNFEHMTANKRFGEVRPRYSTGDQGQYRPIFLGCLSRGEQNSTRWFLLTPKPAVQQRFENNWKEPKWGQLARKFRYTSTEKFTWAVVSIHRSLVLRTLFVEDEDLAECVAQYGVFLEENHGKKVFRYERPNEPSVDKIDFFTLSRWILCSPDGSSAQNFAESWDKVIEKSLKFNNTLTIPDWDELMKAGAAAQIKK